MSIAVDIAFQMVTDELHVTFAEIGGGERNRSAIRAREMIVYALRRNTEMSGPEIARAIGATNHSGVFTILQRLDQRFAENHVEQIVFNRFADRHKTAVADAMSRPNPAPRKKREETLRQKKREESLRLMQTFSLDTLGRLTREETEVVIGRCAG